ncbi:MAG: hypothetical protein ACLPWO_05745 [Thermoplasmata archaeon]
MAHPAVDSDSITLSRKKTEKDLQVSLGMLIAGVAILVVFWILALSGIFSQLSFGPEILAYDVVSGMASVFILIGGIFAAINWWLLRPRRSGPRV